MASGGRTCSSGSPRVSGLRAQEATPGELVQGAGLGCLQVPDPLGCLRLPRDPGRELVAAREVPGPPRVAWAQCEGSCSQRASTDSRLQRTQTWEHLVLLPRPVLRKTCPPQARRSQHPVFIRNPRITCKVTSLAIFPNSAASFEVVWVGDGAGVRPLR